LVAAMSFADIQAAYGARRVATYPLTADKVPAVRAYQCIGASYSAQLVSRFAEAMAAGFCAGARNGVTVVDIDSTDDRLVHEIQVRFGATPLQVITPSGGRHLYYRHSGEARRPRLLPDVDILGAGNVVCADSETAKGRYQIERGSLDDLPRLPSLAAAPATSQRREKVQLGERNTELYRYLARHAVHCDSLDALLDVARTWADRRLAVPLPDTEIVKTATSAWRRRGERKLFMQHVVEGPKFAALVADVEVWAVCSYLMVENGPAATFLIADDLGKARGWPRRLVPRVRRKLLNMEIVECVRPPRKGAAGLYRWCLPRDE
jgi:hypothetical protein